MPLEPSWTDIALRLALTVLAGAVLGFDRSERGRTAGLRTTMLVCLAASVSMIQMNLLLPVTGRTGASFSVMDVMRLPLGILTGMGFIGAGAILRRGDHVQGLTTAAMLWAATVIGLCLGGGQIALGLWALVISAGVLTGLKWVEMQLKEERHATLTLIATDQGPPEEMVRASLVAEGYTINSRQVSYKFRDSRHCRSFRWDVSWRGHRKEVRSPAFVEGLSRHQGVLTLRWAN
jgi:putative Mg2+ transporter-C (MgtC) family protein